MARIKNGILGSFSGKVGTVTGSSWNGIEYMKGNGRRRKKDKSKISRANKSRFGVASKFTGIFQKLFNVTLNPETLNQTGTNVAQSHVLRHCMRGTAPDFYIDYTLALMAKGPLLNANVQLVQRVNKSDIRFSWIINAGQAMANASDKAILVAYCEKSKKGTYSFVADRAKGEAILPTTFKSDKVHTWLSFISENGEVATSIYTGLV